MQSENELATCLVKASTEWKSRIVDGWLIDTEKLVIKETQVIRSGSNVLRSLEGGIVSYSSFRESKKDALNLLKQVAEKQASQANTTLKALEAYKALLEKEASNAK